VARSTPGRSTRQAAPRKERKTRSFFATLRFRRPSRQANVIAFMQPRI
jgi:hypothetical protein